MHHISSKTLKIDDGDLLPIILGKMLVINQEPVFDSKNLDWESFTEQIFLLTWIHTVSLVTQSESIESFVVPD